MATLQQQVRSREMEYEMWQACELKERKGKRRERLQHLLKELWREERETSVAELAEECSTALHCIGEGHAAAILVMQHQERLRRKLESKPKAMAKRRKKVKDSVAQWERNLGRFASHNANFKMLSRPFSSGMPCGWFAVNKKNLSFLQPSDYNHTFLHSHLFINRSEKKEFFKYNEIDAWKAAEVQRKIMKSHKIMQNKINDVMSKRKVLRGQLAGSKSMIEQKLQLLERENDVVERSEKENKRNVLRNENVSKLSKSLPQEVEVKANFGDVMDEASRKIDQDFHIRGGQGLKLTSNVSCVRNGLAKHISSLVEHVQEDQKRKSMDPDATALSCCRDVSKERVSLADKKSKLSLSCRINKK